MYKHIVCFLFGYVSKNSEYSGLISSSRTLGMKLHFHYDRSTLLQSYTYLHGKGMLNEPRFIKEIYIMHKSKVVANGNESPNLSFFKSVVYQRPEITFLYLVGFS